MATGRLASELEALERSLHYSFRDRRLLERALTHRSASAHNNERLEFLGDAVLDYVIARHLYEARPLDGEDRMTMVRATLVRGETLAAVARAIDLGRALRLGTGARRSGDQDRDSILANALEAVIGAVHEDGGIDAARALVVHLLRQRLDNLDDGEEVKDAKTRLQEWLQARRYELPVYELVQSFGQDHEREFLVRARSDALGAAADGVGTSRKEAEKQAAERLLGMLEEGVGMQGNNVQ